jgi:hypothetical protein
VALAKLMMAVHPTNYGSPHGSLKNAR